MTNATEVIIRVSAFYERTNHLYLKRTANLEDFNKPQDLLQIFSRVFWESRKEYLTKYESGIPFLLLNFLPPLFLHVTVMSKAVSNHMTQTNSTEAFLNFPQFLQANIRVTLRPAISRSFPINHSQITLPPTLYTQIYWSCRKINQKQNISC